MQETAPLLNREKISKISNKFKKSSFIIPALLLLVAATWIWINGELRGNDDKQNTLKIQESSTYIGAVLEYNVLYHDSTDPVSSTEEAKEWQNKNIERITPYIVSAGNQNVDILVLGEYALNGVISGREEMFFYLEVVPDPNNCTDSNDCRPCNNTDFDDRTTLQQLSCLANDNNLYLVVNYGDIVYCDDDDDMLCPDDGHYQYNTEIVFNNNGEIIAKYHKMHTTKHDEYAFDTMKDEEYVSFTMISPSDGITKVEFGILICYDTMYSSPILPLIHDGINNFVLSHWWSNKGPAINIVQFANAFAATYGINLLYAASTWYNGDEIPSDSSGSGIILNGGTDGMIDFYNIDTEIEDDFISELIISDEIPLNILNKADEFPTESHTVPLETTDNSTVQQNCNITKILHEITPLTSFPKTFSHSLSCNNFSCDANVTINANTEKNWLYMSIFSGFNPNHDGDNIYYFEDICSIGICDKDCYAKTTENAYNSHTSFSAMSIRATYKYPAVFILHGGSMGKPSDNLHFMKTNRDEHTITISADNIDKKILDLTVIGREFKKDTKVLAFNYTETSVPTSTCTDKSCYETTAVPTPSPVAETTSISKGTITKTIINTIIVAIAISYVCS